MSSSEIGRKCDRMRDETILPIGARFEVLEIAKRELAVILSEGNDKALDAFAQGAADSLTPSRGMTGPFVQSHTFATNVTGSLRQSPELPIIDAEVIDDKLA